ncbi:host factor-I protein [Melghirimyces thermohalophilus]|uniref:Host factor-I protein n=1 Tax=Melghirimyces thermohalophilus TaxID=1236220 RepID=A0A1G6IEN5_9BACL|nr:RNA chaperone Hfq [Melghirimyces thermohalophilus]SDC04833.1 host factor-I protein [Melghirimyces thermohalophilus]
MGKVNIQDRFLDHLRKQQTPVTVFLTNGVQIRGAIEGHDQYTIYLNTKSGPPRMLYKQFVSTIVPSKPVNLSPPKNDFSSTE